MHKEELASFFVTDNFISYFGDQTWEIPEGHVREVGALDRQLDLVHRELLLLIAV